MNYSYAEGPNGLGGNIKGGDPATHCPRVWEWMVGRFGVRHAIDVGCGEGHAALAISRLGVYVVAMDGMRHHDAVFPIVCHDMRDGPFVIDNIDLVWSSEFVEHVGAHYVGNIIETFREARVVIMSHALPGQAGHHHVNCQPPEYWIERMETVGMRMLGQDTAKLRELAAMDGAYHMARTGMVFQ